MTNSLNRYVLSCFHVLADIANPVSGQPVSHPVNGKRIAELWTWMNLVTAGNLVDCAIARLHDPNDFAADLQNIGRPNLNPIAAHQFQSVKKSGSITGVTLGVVSDVSADFPVAYTQGNYGFVDQILVKGVGGLFARKGDSGSLVVDAASLSPVGLLFAVDGDLSLVNPISPILTKLKIRFA